MTAEASSDAPPRRWLGDGAWLIGGAAVNGLAAYAYLALGTRQYGATDFAAVSVLWSIWAVAGAAVVFPIQHEVTRRLESGRGDAPVHDVLPPLLATIAGLSLATAGVTWLLADPLFGSDDPLNPLMAGWIVCGAGLSGLVRGTTAGRRRFVSTSVAIAAENVARLAGAVAVVALGWGVGAYTLALGLGTLAMLGWIRSLRFRPTGQTLDEERGFAGLARGFGGLAGASVISQIVLTSSPVLLALTGGTRAMVTSLFAALALFRAPYLLLLGLTARITGTLTNASREHDRRRLARARLAFAGVAVGATGAYVLFALTFADEVLRLLFGPTVRLDRVDLGMLAGGNGMATGAILLVLLLMARGRSAAALGAWLVALVPGAAFLLVADSGTVHSVVGAFLVAECTAVVALVLVDLRAERARSRPPEAVDLVDLVPPDAL